MKSYPDRRRLIEIVASAGEEFFGGVPEVVMWFIALAQARSGLNSGFAQDRKFGVFAIRERTFRSVARKLRIGHPDIFNPEHNSRVAGFYIRWAMDKFASRIPERHRRFDAAVACLDFGFVAVASWLNSRGFI